MLGVGRSGLADMGSPLLKGLLHGVSDTGCGYDRSIGCVILFAVLQSGDLSFLHSTRLFTDHRLLPSHGVFRLGWAPSMALGVEISRLCGKLVLLFVRRHRITWEGILCRLRGGWNDSG